MRTVRSLKMWQTLAPAIALLLIASMTGCSYGGPKTTDPPPGQFVRYVSRGFVAPADVIEAIRVEDPTEREAACEKAFQPIEDTFLVPGDTFLWLLKQAARARRLQTEAGD